MVRKFLRRFLFGRPIVIVSGLPRSGTSMAMKMLDAGGLDLLVDDVRIADADNPKGYYEYQPVMNLEHSGGAWLNRARGKGVKVISHLLRFLPSTNNYKVILMRRDIGEVLLSQARMLERRGESPGAEDSRMSRLLEADLWRAEYQLRVNTHFDYMVVDHRDVLNQPLRQANVMNEFLGGGLKQESMAEVVDPKLYRNRMSEGYERAQI